jgi:predicted nucleic acid-binding protein
LIVVPDTSAWVEFLRDTDHPIANTVALLLEAQTDIVLTECVYMEILAGARSDREAEDLTTTFSQFPTLRLTWPDDFERAARIFRDCRTSGRTIRSQIDCLIAVPVIEVGGLLLHNDSDFEAIARHSALEIYR